MLMSGWICGAPSRQPTRNLHKGLSQRIWILIKAVNGLSPVHILFLNLIVENWAQILGLDPLMGLEIEMHGQSCNKLICQFYFLKQREEGNHTQESYTNFILCHTSILHRCSHINLTQ